MTYIQVWYIIWFVNSSPTYDPPVSIRVNIYLKSLSYFFSLSLLLFFSLFFLSLSFFLSLFLFFLSLFFSLSFFFSLSLSFSFRSNCKELDFKEISYLVYNFLDILTTFIKYVYFWIWVTFLYNQFYDFIAGKRRFVVSFKFSKRNWMSIYSVVF